MRLPSLKVIIATQVVIWCCAGAWILGPKILLYPLAWVLVGGAFYLHLRMYPLATSSATSSRPADAEPAKTIESETEEMAAS